MKIVGTAFKQGILALCAVLQMIFQVSFAAPIIDALQNKIDRYTQSGLMPGIVLGIYVDNNPPIFLSSGVSNIETKEAIHPRFLFRFGSSIKTVTAMILIDAINKTDLPATMTLREIVSRYHNPYSTELRTRLTAYPALNDISLLQLLNHQSHLMNEQMTADYLFTFSHHKNQPTTFLDHVNRSAKRGFNDPSFAYANINYLLLGKVIETIYNQPFRQVIEDFFRQLNLPNLHYYDTQAALNDWCPSQVRAYEPVTLGSIATFHTQSRFENYRQSQLDYIDVTCAYDATWDDGPAGALLATPIALGELAKVIFDKTAPISKQYWLYQHAIPKNSAATYTWGNLPMQYHLGVWSHQLPNGHRFYRLIGEQWGFSGGAIYFPKQDKKSALLLIYAINTDQPDYLEGTKDEPGLIQSLLAILDGA